MNQDAFPDSRRSGEMQSRYEKVLCFAWVMAFIYFVERPIMNNGTVTRMIWISSLLIVTLFSFQIKLRRIEFVSLAIPFIILAFSIITQGASSTEHFLAAFCYLGMMLVVQKCLSIETTKKTFDFIFYSCVALSLLFTAYSFTPIVHMMELDGVMRTTPYFVFNLGNANTVSMYLYVFLCVLLINLPYRKHKLLVALLICYDLYMIYWTNGRSTLAATLLVILVSVLLSKRKIKKPIICACALCPVLFAAVYLYLYYVAGYPNFSFLNKNFFSGRQNTYRDYLSLIDTPLKVLFGNFSESRFQNAENVAIAIYASIGLIGLIAFYIYFIRMLFGIADKPFSKMRTISLICILGLFVESSTEASFFLGGFPGVIFISTFVLLSNYTVPNSSTMSEI